MPVRPTPDIPTPLFKPVTPNTPGVKNTKMLSNEAALREGNARATWKRNLTLEYFRNVKYQINQVAPFDHRDMYSLIPLLVDISSVAYETEDVKREYFLAKLKVIEQEFVLTKDPKTRLPYLKQMYETVKTDYDINWDDPAEIDHLFCSTAAQQMLGMMVEKLPEEVLSLYPDKQGAQKLDNISILNYINTRKFQNAVSRNYYELNKNFGIGSVDEEDPLHHIQDDVLRALCSANDANNNVALLDPDLMTETTTEFFLGGEMKITVTQPDRDDPGVVEETHYYTEDFVKSFLGLTCGVSSQAVNEFRTVGVYSQNSAETKKDFLLINGKPVSKLIAEKKEELGDDPKADQKALLSVGQMLREAMIDGKSVVTLMRPHMLENGRVSFTHQELKVDLDKLSKHYHEKRTAWGKFLAFVGIRKINKFPSNQERDKNQEKMKRSYDYREGLKEAENKFIEQYNENSRKIRDNEMKKELEGKKVSKDKFVNAFPEVTNIARFAAYNDEVFIKNKDARVKLDAITEVLEEENGLEESIDDDELSKSESRESDDIEAIEEADEAEEDDMVSENETVRVRLAPITEVLESERHEIQPQIKEDELSTVMSRGGTVK